MNKKQILNEAKKVLTTELQGIKTIVKSFNDVLIGTVVAQFHNINGIK